MNFEVLTYAAYNWFESQSHLPVMLIIQYVQQDHSLISDVYVIVSQHLYQSFFNPPKGICVVCDLRNKQIALKPREQAIVLTCLIPTEPLQKIFVFFFTIRTLFYHLKYLLSFFSNFLKSFDFLTIHEQLIVSFTQDLAEIGGPEVCVEVKICFTI